MSSKLGFTFYQKDWWSSDSFYELTPLQRYIYLECIFLMYNGDGYMKTQKTHFENRIRFFVSDEDWQIVTAKFIIEGEMFTHISVNSRMRKTLANRENGKAGGRPLKNPKNPTEKPKKNPPYKRERESKEKENKKEYTYREIAHLSLSIEDYQKLNINYDKDVIDGVLDAIENYKNNKSYTSLYLTAKNWLKKEPSKTPIATTTKTNQLQPKYTDEDVY